MEQLSSIDASFLQAETPNLPMHVSSVSIYDPSTAPQGLVRFKDILQMYERAVYDVPLFRRRLVQVPGNLDFPYWIEDPDFDIEFHVRHEALPQPADWRQFYIQLARIHSQALDLQRPLWEVYVIEGLNGLEGIPDGSFAVVQKIHHAAIDGAALQRLFLSMHSFEPKAPVLQSDEHKVLIKEVFPSSLPLVLKSYQNTLRRPFKFGKAVGKLVSGMRKVSEARKAGEIGEAEEGVVSRFNGDISPYRVVTSASFDFSEFKQLRHAVPGATVNDLAISIIAGALRLYLEEKGDALDKPLLIQMPVNIRSEDQQDKEGNQLTTINASTCSHIADPLQRLQAVHASTVSGKKRMAAMGSTLMEEVADSLGPMVTRGIFSMMESSGRIQALSNLMPAGPNLAFSNMPGPPMPVYLAGAEIKWGIGLGPLMPNMGLFITGSSAIGKFVFGVTACRERVPDPAFFQQCLYRSYEESKQVLSAAVEQAAAAASAQPAKKRVARKKSASSSASSTVAAEPAVQKAVGE